MRDEIMRLAERAADMLDGFEQALRRYAPIEDVEEWPYHPEITDTAAELRALARTDHVEDKLGMVPEGWKVMPPELTDDMVKAVYPLHWFLRPGDDLRENYRRLFAAAPAPDHSLDFGNMVTSKPGSWPEDFSHENGNYECKCCHCGATFYGYKRRVTCKVCASPAPDHSAGVLRIPRAASLDPIIVYFEDSAPGKGRITIACYGDAWTGAWGAMGNRTVRQFVAGCDPGYLSGSLLELRKASEHFRKYTKRVSAAVIDALAQQAKDQDAET